MGLKDYIATSIALLAFIYAFARGIREDRRITKLEKEHEEEKARLTKSQRPVLHVVSFKREKDEDIVESQYPDRVPDSLSTVTLVNVGSACSKISVVAPGNFGFIAEQYAFQEGKLTFTFGRAKGADDQQTFFIDYQTVDGFEGRLAYRVCWSFSTYILQELTEDEAKRFNESLQN